jgi:predicted outer membrane repeat protein
MKKITILTLCLTLFLTGSLYSKTVWVSAEGAGTFDGLSEANALASFSAALALITDPGDVLRVVGTVAPGSPNLTAKNFVYTIEGDEGGSTLTGISGAVRMFTINGSSIGQNVTFKNIIFSGSTDSTGAGGGVFFSNSAVTVNFQNCKFVGNSINNVAGGGALHFTNSTVTFDDCLFKGNIAPQNGGAIAIYAACTVTMNRCTFVQNKTTNTGSVGGGALYITGSTPTIVTINHCTFFENSIAHSNQDYGTIRSDNGNTTINNSLFYNNKVTNTSVVPPVLGGPSDWGSSPNGIQTFNKSLGQWISGNIDAVTSSIVKKNTSIDPLLLVGANLASSSLTYNDALGKVTYIVPTVAGENSPIGYVSAGVDAGAWQSGLTLPALSVKDNEFAANFSVSYHATTKNLKVLRSNDDSVSLEIYNLMGAKVLSRANANKEENINASSLQSGVYILVVKGSGNKSFSQKFVIN